MLDRIIKKLKTKNIANYFTFGAIGIYVVAIVSISVAWAGTKAIQRNYQLLREVAVLEQEADISRQRVENQKLLNEYYKSDAFLELAARRQLNKAAPGEKLLIVPKEVALSKLPESTQDKADSDKDTKADLANWQAWLRFLTGRGFDD